MWDRRRSYLRPGTEPLRGRCIGMSPTRLIIDCPDSNLTIIACVGFHRGIQRREFSIAFQCPCGDIHEITLTHISDFGWYAVPLVTAHSP